MSERLQRGLAHAAWYGNRVFAVVDGANGWEYDGVDDSIFSLGGRHVHE